MSLTQVHFAGRDDSAELSSGVFTYGIDSNWAQEADKAFRVRFEIEGTGTIGGTIEASIDNSSWFAVSATSGTVCGALSEQFSNADTTTDLIDGSAYAWTTGNAATRGTAAAVTLTAQTTELEYALRLVGDDLDNGAEVYLRIDGLDTYERTPLLQTSKFSDLDEVRLKIGDTNEDDPLLYDSEIRTLLASWPNNIELAAAAAAEAIAAKYARDFNFATDGQTFNRRERVEHYTNLAAALRSRGGQFEWPKP